MTAMSWIRPKSLSGLMLLGLAVIAVPLVVAILNAALQIRTLADTSRQLVVEGVGAARASQDLVSLIASLERTTSLYQVLRDPKLIGVYREQNDQRAATRAKLAAHLKALS